MTGVEGLCDRLASATVDEVEKDKEVSFSGKGLMLDTEADAAEIVKSIESCRGMTALRLDGNTLGIPAAQSIAKALESQPNFKKALWKDMFTRRTVDEIPQALSHLSNSIMLANAKLVELDLSDNAFGPRGLIGIVKLLESPSCYTLSELHLNNNGLGISGATMLADALCNSVQNSQKDGSPLALKIFVCGRNRLENEGAAAVARFFKMLGTLESVAMPQNGICSPGIKDLADAFTSNPNLRVINLEDNSFTEVGAKFIANCLPSLKYINMLNFGDCLIRSQGAIILAETLKVSCPDLRELYLGFNEINQEGGEAIVEAIENKKMLELLVLNGNVFGESGCDAIRCLISEYGIGEKLGTLSEDDGDEEDEDGNDYENGEDQASDSANEDPDKSVEILENQTHTSPMEKTSPADFYASPTSTSLILLHNTREDLLSVLPENPTVSEYLDLFMKICSVVKPGDEAAKVAACNFIDEILARAVKLCAEDIFEFNNNFLVYLGLLKGEDKKYFYKVDLSGALFVLQHVVKQSYFHKSTRDQLQFFISRPLSYATACEKTKHCLMQILYNI